MFYFMMINDNIEHAPGSTPELSELRVSEWHLLGLMGVNARSQSDIWERIKSFALEGDESAKALFRVSVEKACVSAYLKAAGATYTEGLAMFPDDSNCAYVGPYWVAQLPDHRYVHVIGDVSSFEHCPDKLCSRSATLRAAWLLHCLRACGVDCSEVMVVTWRAGADSTPWADSLTPEHLDSIIDGPVHALTGWLADCMASDSVQPFGHTIKRELLSGDEVRATPQAESIARELSALSQKQREIEKRRRTLQAMLHNMFPTARRIVGVEYSAEKRVKQEHWPAYRAALQEVFDTQELPFTLDELLARHQFAVTSRSYWTPSSMNNKSKGGRS